MNKTYILDTNVLVHDPDCIFKFEDNDIVIPMTVIEELDDLKERRNSVSPDARSASRNIKAVLEGEKILKGELTVESAMIKETSALPGSCKDNHILRTAIFAHRNHRNCVLITKDVNVWIKARALDLEVDDYKNDQVSHSVEGTCLVLDIFKRGPDYGWSDKYDATIFNPEDIKEWTGRDPEKIRYILSEGNVFKTWVAEGLFLVDTNSSLPTDLGSIKPRNDEQRLAMAALKEPNDFVCLEGPAGSGKTFLAMAYALDQVLEKKAYKSIVILRSSDSNHIGHLPGTEEEKMMPWMQGFVDNLEMLVGNDKGQVELVIQQANIKFRSLDLVRGRSYQDTLVIVDEAQNNTRHQLKAILTRLGEGSKMIMLGNLAQIDTPYLNERTSGLTHVCAKMPGFDKGAICVFREVHRSRLTKYAEENL